MERPDAEDARPVRGRADQVVDDEAELEHPVLALGPRLLEQAVRRSASSASHRSAGRTSTSCMTLATSVPVGVVDRAPDQTAMAGDGQRLLGVEMPAVEADRAVEPDARGRG